MAVSGVIATSLPKVLLGAQPTTAGIMDEAVKASLAAAASASTTGV